VCEVSAAGMATLAGGGVIRFSAATGSAVIPSDALIQSRALPDAAWTRAPGARDDAPMPLDLTDLELEAARACRTLAYQEGEAAGEPRRARADREHGEAHRRTGEEVRGGAPTLWVA